MPAPAQPDLHSRLALALQKRLPLLDEPHADALRLFNGFVEGESSLVADLYARTLVIFNHADPPETALPAIQEAQAFFLSRLRWVQAVVLKTRHAVFIEGRRGSLTYGSQPNRRICEEGVWYALDLLSSQDSGFYLDTRGLRQWLRLNMPGKSVLDTFAYTGSLGVAARAGGAQRVVYVDLDRSALNLAKDSYSLNGYPITKADFISGDFFTVASRMRRRGEQFDCVIVDPPFFSITGKGRVDQVRDSARLINKARPLVRPGGWLVAVNNALYVSGAAYIETLQALCSDGHMSLAALIPAPDDITGYPDTICRGLPADPAPFNHSTKMALLKIVD